MRERLRVLDLGRPVRGDKVERLERILVQVRWFAFDHFDGHDTQRPDVYLGTVFLASDDLGGHPIGCTDHRSPLRARRVRYLRAEPKVGQFDVSGHAQEHIIALDIPMNDTMPVKVLEPLRCLPRDGGDLALSHQVRSDDVREGTSLHVLHHNPEVILVQERVDVVDDVGVPRGTHDQDLVDNQVFLRLFIEIHLFDGNGNVGANLVGGVYTTRRTLANFDQIAVKLGRIRICAYLLQAPNNIVRAVLVLLLSPPWSGNAGALGKACHSRTRLLLV